MADPTPKDLAAALARLKRQLGFEDRPNVGIRDPKAGTKCPEVPKAKSGQQT
jgi:hypothetical protein